MDVLEEANDAVVIVQVRLLQLPLLTQGFEEKVTRATPTRWAARSCEKPSPHSTGRPTGWTPFEPSDRHCRELGGDAACFRCLAGPGDGSSDVGSPLCLYPNFVSSFEALPVPIRVHEEDGFLLDPDAVRKQVGPQTRALVLNSPANPTGSAPRPTGWQNFAGR